MKIKQTPTSERERGKKKAKKFDYRSEKSKGWLLHETLNLKTMIIKIYI